MGDLEEVGRDLDNLRYKSKLYDVFSQIDSDDSGCVSLDEWRRYVKSLDLDLILPDWAIAKLFCSIDVEGNDEIGSLEFEQFFDGFFVPPSVDFKPILMGALLKSMLQSDLHGSYRTVLVYKYESLLNTIQKQCG